MAEVQDGSWHCTEFVVLQASISEQVHRLTMLVSIIGRKHYEMLVSMCIDDEGAHCRLCTAADL